ncbi:MAG: CDP-alcohol phosphatidyltransferase family protein [Candidatus Symbiothrix sp.]|nr:CDP-alcohol phosphatidyltransferase family protein [Candidatus Symbiothrix sp.]
METQKKEYEASLKSIETENVIDRVFYRPIGFRLALALKPTGITPNTITIISIFFGVAAGILFYPNDMGMNSMGILLLICANILDCVDGQLARLTGIKSAIGRILDGLAGDFWFISIYICLALRASLTYDTSLCFTLAVLAALSNLLQSNITDYYKTLHLFFISKTKGAEFETIDQVKKKHSAMPYGLSKTFYFLYVWYTMLQVQATPKLQALLKQLHTQYGDDIPEEVRIRLRQKSKEIMATIDFLTFNGRTIVLFIIILTGFVWAYFLYEIVVLNIVLYIVLRKHEKMCRNFFTLN